MSQKQKYGCINSNVMDLLQPKPGILKTSTVLKAKSGRFLVWDISDGASAKAGWRAPASDENALTGYTEYCTAASVASAKVPIFPLLPNMIFEVPYATSGAAATLTETVGAKLMGVKCDIYTDGDGVQYANCSSTTDGLFNVVGYDVDENTIYVTVNQAKVNQVS